MWMQWRADEDQPPSPSDIEIEIGGLAMRYCGMWGRGVGMQHGMLRSVSTGARCMDG